jgi:hypothetical protein
MGIIEKIKSFFFAANEDAKKKLEQYQSPAESIIPQPKGNLIGQCPLCLIAIGSDDRVKHFKGELAHKRCVKKAQKAMLNGESM